MIEEKIANQHLKQLQKKMFDKIAEFPQILLRMTFILHFSISYDRRCLN